jgi:hypothetical protein
LRWFADFIHTGKMETIIQDENVYYWINHTYALSQNPIMRIKSIEAFSRRLRRMERVGLLFSQEQKLQGKTKKFYRFNPKAFDRLTFHTLLKSRVSTEANNKDAESHPTQKLPVHPTLKSGVHPTQKSPNSSIKEIILSEDSIREREEEQPKDENELSGKASRANSPPPSFLYYLSFFEIKEQNLSSSIFEQITNREAWQKACQFWREKGYNPKNLDGLYDRYQRFLKSSPSPKLSEEPPSSYATRPDIREQKEKPISKDEKEKVLLEGEKRTREYFQKKGWHPAKIEEQVKQIRQTLMNLTTCE